MLSAAVMFFAASCEQSDIAPALKMQQTTVPYTAGRQSVSVEASGNWVLALYFQDDDQWASLSAESGSGSRNVVLEYGENNSEKERKVNIVLTASGTDVVLGFTQLPENSAEPDPEPDPDPDPDPDPEPDPEPAVFPGWMELPAVKETEDCHFYSHDMRVAGRTCRNYSFLWDRDNLVSHWVAYPLNSFLIGSGSRTNDWDYDPLVPRDEQPTLFHGYDGGYDRGHQLPSADRYTDNPSTFYFTNMTPQLGSLNQNIWRKFEEQVREWARACDTLYVVTGCVLEGSRGKAYDNSGKAVTVPGGYYKALLCYKNSPSFGDGGYVAAGFYFEHRGYSQTDVTSDMSMSIDELEEKTGLDFFVNLKKQLPTLSDRIEAKDPETVNFWWN